VRVGETFSEEKDTFFFRTLHHFPVFAKCLFRISAKLQAIIKVIFRGAPPFLQENVTGQCFEMCYDFLHCLVMSTECDCTMHVWTLNYFCT
jgi:hypothetical protein